MNTAALTKKNHTGGIFYTCYEDLRAEAAWTVHIREVVDEWIKKGEDVTLFIPKTYPFTRPPRCRIVCVPTIDIRFIREYLYLFLLPLYVLGHGIKRRPRAVYSREMALMSGVALACALLGIPLIMEINGSMLLEHAMGGTSRVKIIILRALQHFNLRVVKHLVFVNAELVDMFQKTYRLKDKSIHVVTNGVNTELFSPKDRTTAIEGLGLNPHTQYITFVGSFYPHSHTPLIIHAASLVIQSHPNAVFLMVGDGEERKLCETIAASLSIQDRVVFCGMRPHGDIPAFINASSILVYLIAGYSSGASLKMLEYLSSGGVVVSNCSDIHGKALVDGTHYYRIADVSLDSLAEAIKTLLVDTESAETIRRNAREFILRHFSWEKTAGRLIDIIDTTNGRKRNGS
ncbi:MAG: glycosyltransferase family 4 protein [Deltaproteobacteria bacterium]|nr:glycosyltransferase family 4 protein [Candidatus Zymogenaceae bacterium]